MKPFADRHWRSADGLTLYARDYAGAGGAARLPVVCLHGLTRNSKDFEDVAPLLAKGGRRILVPDIRGRGRSDRDPNPAHYHPRVYARDVLGMMDALGIGRAIFLGTSMGGLINMVLAAKRPRAVAGSILNDVGPEVAPEGIARILGYAGKTVAIEDWGDATDYVRRTNAVAFPHFGEEDWRRLAERTFREGADGPLLDYDPAIATVSGKAPPQWATPIAWLLFRKLARRRPTLLIRGERSDIITAAIAGRMARRAPSLRVVEVPGVGHAPTLAESAALAAIEQYLADVP